MYPPLVSRLVLLRRRQLAVVSSPAGADIEADGSFIGNAPSQIILATGDHTGPELDKSGYKSWERKSARH